MDTSRPRYLHMFLVFVKIGLFTIGGGPAMIPLIRDEFVEKQKWISNVFIPDPFLFFNKNGSVMSSSLIHFC